MKLSLPTILLKLLLCLRVAATIFAIVENIPVRRSPMFRARSVPASHDNNGSVPQALFCLQLSKLLSRIFSRGIALHG